MYRYAKTTQIAIAIMSRLAEAHHAGGASCASVQIARDRRLPRPLVAKLLTVLSQAGLISGSPGPGGGYRLARAPEHIRLIDIASVFERTKHRSVCPFGLGYCGNHTPCPLHGRIVELDRQLTDFLATTTLAVFCPGTDSAGTGAEDVAGPIATKAGRPRRSRAVR